MQSFDLYLTLGFEHISDLAGFDHILFLIALCAIYKIEEWRRVLILVTAFTVGHSVTLALSALGTITIPSDVIEFLIPTTILLTALHNVLSKPKTSQKRACGSTTPWRSFLALFTGWVSQTTSAPY